MRPRNYGLLDHRTALEWVKEHIQSFGGVPPLGRYVTNHGFKNHPNAVLFRTYAEHRTRREPGVLRGGVGMFSRGLDVVESDSMANLQSKMGPLL